MVGGVTASGLLYLVAVGLLLTPSSGADGAADASMASRALAFAVTFGLVTAAHWSFGLARRWVLRHTGTMMIVKAFTIAMVAFAFALILGGGRWQLIVGVGHGPALVVLIVLWLAMTHLAAGALDNRRPAARMAGA
jgi:hypothetical protein